MWSMWDAPSDRDYYGEEPEPEEEDPDNYLPPTPQYKEVLDADEACPF